MITHAELKTRKLKDLVHLAKQKKVPGWHAMRKDELVKALLRHARNNGKGVSMKKQAAPAKELVRSAETEHQLLKIREKLTQVKDLASPREPHEADRPKDRLVVMVRDPFWLHAYWELSRRSIERARAAMSQYWHTSRPILRLCEVLRESTAVSLRKILRDIEIHGGVNNWYIDVRDPPKTFQLEIGYLASNGKFYSLARSNVVTTPAADTEDHFDKNWSDVAKDFDRIFALSGGYSESENRGELKEIFEEQLQRPMGDTTATQFGIAGLEWNNGSRKFQVEVDTELIVHGVTEPGAHVTLHGEPVAIRDDGTFAVRFHLPDRRHILPVVASSRDGVEQRTIVLSIDRNTKVLEPLIREPGE